MINQQEAIQLFDKGVRLRKEGAYYEAIECFEKLYDKGYKQVEIQIVDCYMYALEFKTAVKWLENVPSDRRSDLAFLRLAKIYYQGLGVLSDKKKAMSYLEKIPEGTSNLKEFNMAIYYYNCDKNELNYILGIEYADKAIKKGAFLAVYIKSNFYLKYGSFLKFILYKIKFYFVFLLKIIVGDRGGVFSIEEPYFNRKSRGM